MWGEGTNVGSRDPSARLLPPTKPPVTESLPRARPLLGDPCPHGPCCSGGGCDRCSALWEQEARWVLLGGVWLQLNFRGQKPLEK